MPFQERTLVMLREEFVRLAMTEGVNFSELCRRYRIGRRTGYRWRQRYVDEGVSGLADQSRRPHTSPSRTAAELEALVLALRAEHPSWGGRKLARRLRDLGHPQVPAPSTITAILRRHDRLDGPGAGAPRAFVRFEHERPNALWQMDFKGHVPCESGRCHPLTVLDDHSRYNVILGACADERTRTVQERLVVAFEEYGLPERIATDNGSPWGDRAGSPYTPLTVWLLRLGVAVSHSRPYHPQTLGKDERFHRTLKLEALSSPLAGLDDAQCRFDRWRHVYNCERPHEALGGAVPASRYTPSPRVYPRVLPPLDYDPGDLVRTVQDHGLTHFLGRHLLLPRAFRGHRVAFRPTARDGCYTIHFATAAIAEIDLTVIPKGVSHVPERLAPIFPV